MAGKSIFIFDASYPNADIALALDENKRYVVVSDRLIEPPPGHIVIQLKTTTDLASFARDLQVLRAEWRKTNGERCIVIIGPQLRKEQILLNTVRAFGLSRHVCFFDGVVSRPIWQVWWTIVGWAVLVLAKVTIWGLKSQIEEARFHRTIEASPARATPEGDLFGVYRVAQAFSLPLDEVIEQPEAASIYGRLTRGWYLPAFSHRRQRYSVRTTRHRLHDVLLHVVDLGSSTQRLLFRGGRILDYPYFLGRTAPHIYKVGVRRQVKSLDRGIDMLHYTSGYYHWLLEGVPRILDLIDDGVDFLEYPLILPPLEPFHRQVLEVLGISSETQVIEVDRGDWCHLRECVVPTAYFPFGAPGLDNPSGQPDRALLLRIRDRLLERVLAGAPPAGGPADRLYISRAKVARRRLSAASEAGVRSILGLHGFQSICLEDLPWTEQVTVMSRAKLIVGLHGAGLANILFAQATALLELHNPMEAKPYFAQMARELNMDYAYVIGKLAGQSSNYDSIEVDPGLLADSLKGLQARSSIPMGQLRF